MEDLIQNADTLFDENPPPSEPFPSPNVAETTSTFTYDSLILSPELSQLAEVENLGFTTRHGPGGILMSTQSSLSSLSMEGRFTPQTTLLSPLQRFTSSNAHTGVEGMSDRQTTVDEWRLQVPPSWLQLSPQPEGLTIPQSPPGSVQYGTSDFTRSSATSLQTGMGKFSA